MTYELIAQAIRSGQCSRRKSNNMTARLAVVEKNGGIA